MLYMAWNRNIKWYARVCNWILHSSLTIYITYFKAKGHVIAFNYMNDCTSSLRRDAQQSFLQHISRMQEWMNAYLKCYILMAQH